LSQTHFVVGKLRYPTSATPYDHSVRTPLPHKDITPQDMVCEYVCLHMCVTLLLLLLLLLEATTSKIIYVRGRDKDKRASCRDSMVDLFVPFLAFHNTLITTECTA